MRAGLFLRIAVYAIGLYALHGAITHGVYYLHLYLIAAPESREGFATGNLGTVIGYCLMPSLFTFVCFAFAGRIERFLLGAAAAERIELAAPSTRLLLRVGSKLLGLYFIVAYLGTLLATLFEFVALKAGNSHFSVEQTTSDFIFNVVGVLLGYFLCVKTDRIVKAIEADDSGWGATK